MAMEKPVNSKLLLFLAIIVIPGNVVSVAKINFSAYGILDRERQFFYHLVEITFTNYNSLQRPAKKFFLDCITRHLGSRNLGKLFFVALCIRLFSQPDHLYPDGHMSIAAARGSDGHMNSTTNSTMSR